MTDLILQGKNFLKLIYLSDSLGTITISSVLLFLSDVTVLGLGTCQRITDCLRDGYSYVTKKYVKKYSKINSITEAILNT